MRENGKIKKIVLCGILTSLAFAFSYIEMLIPSPFAGVPGIKLGLANLIIMLTMYLFSWREAAVVSLARILLSLLLFGNVLSFIYSLSGAALSLIVMIIAEKSGFFGKIGVSIIGGLFHNMGQLFAAAVSTGSFAVFAYLPPLLISGVLTGAFNGAVLTLLLKKLKLVIKY